MPIEYRLLRDQPEPLATCPACGHAPFRSTMRGMVHRRKRRFLLFGAWPYCSIICDQCHQIVGHEHPTTGDVLLRGRFFFPDC